MIDWKRKSNIFLRWSDDSGNKMLCGSRTKFGVDYFWSKRARSSSGRAIDLHSIGKEFESPRVHKKSFLNDGSF
jgi:uncharacterized protein YqjF (DUF2071 family)